MSYLTEYSVESIKIYISLRLTGHYGYSWNIPRIFLGFTKHFPSFCQEFSSSTATLTQGKNKVKVRGLVKNKKKRHV